MKAQGVEGHQLLLFSEQVKGPHLVQGIFAALGDLYTYRLSARLSGLKVAHWTLLCQLSSWFIFYTSSRTLTNSTEQVLTSLALYYYPWPGKPKLVTFHAVR